MRIPTNETATNGPRVQDEPLREGRAKRPYAAPTLVKFGTVAKLTQGASGPNADGGSFQHN